jgi:serine/threonine protein kinase
MGDVFAATDRRSGDDVAIKLIRGSLLSDRSAQRRSSEARLPERIDDPNAVRVLDHAFGSARRALVTLFLVLECWSRSRRSRQGCLFGAS